MTYTALLITVMALCTMLIRFLPFFVFDHESSPPKYILYLGRVLPMASIAMLVVYCLRDTDLTSGIQGYTGIIASVFVFCLQAWKRNLILSILGGTVIYMILIQIL